MIAAINRLISVPRALLKLGHTWRLKQRAPKPGCISVKSCVRHSNVRGESTMARDRADKASDEEAASDRRPFVVALLTAGAARANSPSKSTNVSGSPSYHSGHTLVVWAPD